MKLYKYTCGEDEKVGVAANIQDAHERRGEVDPTFSYLPITIEEYKVPGYTVEIQASDITAEPMDPSPIGVADFTVPTDETIDAWEKSDLKAFLDLREIDYTPNWGEKRLRDTIKAWVAKKTKEEIEE